MSFKFSAYRTIWRRPFNSALLSLVYFRFLHLQSCHLPCRLCLCMNNLPSALSPARRPPPPLLCRDPPPLHSTGSTSFLCRPPHTRDSCPLTVRLTQNFLQTPYRLREMAGWRAFLMLYFCPCVDQSSGRSPVSPGFPQTQPLRFTAEGGGPGKLRPVGIKDIQDVIHMFTFIGW